MSTVNTYDIGDQVRLAADFKVNAVNVDPGAVTLKVKLPSGSISTYTYPANLTKDSTGQYHRDISITLSGNYYYRWEGTGAAEAAEEGQFIVRPQQVV